MQDTDLPPAARLRLSSLLAGSLHTVALYATMSLTPCLFVFTSLALTVTSSPIALVNVGVFNETRNFSSDSDCSLPSTLTVKHDQQFGNVSCTFFFEEGFPSQAQYQQTTEVANATVPSTFNCPDRRTCFAEARVENRVNCSLGFVGQDSRYSYCFNYSIYVGHNRSIPPVVPVVPVPSVVPEPPERKRDFTWWITGLVTVILGVGAWAVTIGVLCKRMRTKECDMNNKLKHELNDLKGKLDEQINELKENLQLEMNKKIEILKIQYERDQEVLKMRFSATHQSPPLIRSGSNSASVPHELSEQGNARAVTVGYGVRSGTQRPYGRQSSDPTSEHGSTGDAVGHTALTRDEFEHNPAGDHSHDSSFDDRTVSFKAGI